MPLLAHNRIAIPGRFVDILAAGVKAVAAPPSATHLAALLAERFDLQSVMLSSAARYALFDLLRDLPPERRVVLLPAFGCSILVDVVRASGCEPRLVDIELERFGFALSDLDRKLDPSVGAVVAVHEFGIPFDPSIPECLRAYPGTLLVEDIAVAFGARRAGGVRVGTEGDAVLISGGLGKPLSAFAFGALGVRAGVLGDRVAPQIGRNGAIEAAHALLLATARIISGALPFTLISQAAALEHDERFRPEQAALPAARFDAALILRLLERLDADLVTRSHIAKAVLAKFTDYGWRGPVFGDDLPLFGRLPIELPDGLERARAIAAFRAWGVDLTVPGRRSLLERVTRDERSFFPGAIRAENRLLTLTINPSRPDPTDLEMRVQNALLSLAEGRR
jgi:dTDP-4-amino-4,6-dideoxygalactose transaminase